MKKRLLILPLAAMLLAGCGETPNPNPNPNPGPDPVIPTKTLTGIEVSAQPTKVNYKEGETFNPAGMVVNAIYNDGTKEAITNYQVSNQALVAGATSIEISYQGKTTTVAITVAPVARYTITFMSNESDKIEDVIYKEGETPSYSYSVPSTAQYEYEFLGWSLTPNGEVLAELPKATQNATYYAIIRGKTRKYSVIFKDFKGNVLSSDEVEYGSAPTAPSYDPEDTAQYDYTFVGWALTQGGVPIAKPELVSGPVTYYAIVESKIKSYTVKFFDENGTEIQSGSLQYGSIPSCDYEVEDTAEWDYTTKWAVSAGGTALSSLPTVSGDANYYAVATRVKQKYQITFLNEDGSAYKNVTVEYGLVPSVTSPSKAADKQYSYAFGGWSTTKGGEALASLPAVTGAATYYATFRGTLNKYKLTLDLNYDDCEEASYTADYGTEIDDEDLESYIPEREGYHFAGWCTDSSCEEKAVFPITLTDNTTLYAKWNEKVDVKGYLKSLLGILDQKPIDYIPESLRTNFEENLVEESDFLNFEEIQNVSSIKTEGFGAQWEMVLDNIAQSEKFFWITSASDSIISATISAFISYFESNPDKTEKEEKTSKFNASCQYKNKVLSFTFAFNNEISVPLLGDLKPSVEMTYDIETKAKTMKVIFNQYNVMKTAITDNEYLFGLSYGLSDENIRTAYCQLDKIVNPNDEKDISFEGHIAEFITIKGIELPTKSMADFYINNEYCTVVGTKVDKLIGSEAFINELYSVETGKYLGAMVEEHVEKELDLKIYKKDFSVTYHTFWFNLIDIYGINNVAAISNGELDPSNNHHDVFVNKDTKVFKVEHNKDPFLHVVNTSRQYDIEMKKHFYYYKDNENNIKEKELSIPMMFVQDDDSNYPDCEYNNTNLSDFNNNLDDVSGIEGGYLKTSEKVISKIRQDCLNYVPLFKQHKEEVTPQTILDWLK